LPRGAQPLVYLEGVVDVRVVDQAFPAYCGTRFFEVGAHDYEKGIGVFGLEGEEPGGIFEGGDGVVDRAGAYDDEEAVEGVCSVDEGDGFVASGYDCFF